MSKLTIDLPDQAIADLHRMAERLGTAVESLATASVVELVTRTEDQFAEVAKKLLAKNAELYRRLA